MSAKRENICAYHKIATDKHGFDVIDRLNLGQNFTSQN